MASGKGLPSDPAAWRGFFSEFGDVVLVANSDAVDLAALTARFDGHALFVFFNKTYKVLDGPFRRPALLVARSSEAGANIVYRREVARVLSPFGNDEFHGILNLKAGPREQFSASTDFGGARVGYLDLAGAFVDFYPSRHLPTSGFALSLWLAEHLVGTRIHLAGFSGQRSEKWKLFKDHDWTFEQTALRLLAQAGRLDLCERRLDRSPLTLLALRFPEIEPRDIPLVAADVLSERLDGADRAVDRLFSLTKPQQRIDRLLRSLKPRTRKERMRDGGG